MNRLTALLEFHQRYSRRFLFRLLLAPAFAFAENFAAHADLGDEHFLMVRASFRYDAICWWSMKQHLADFLKPRLVIMLAELFPTDIRQKITLHHGPRRIVTAVLINSAEQRFESAG